MESRLKIGLGLLPALVVQVLRLQRVDEYRHLRLLPLLLLFVVFPRCDDFGRLGVILRL